MGGGGGNAQCPVLHTNESKMKGTRSAQVYMKRSQNLLFIFIKQSEKTFAVLQFTEADKTH
jgi:hypothetical protein